jgi:hypothetical protein
MTATINLDRRPETSVLTSTWPRRHLPALWRGPH